MHLELPKYETTKMDTWNYKQKKIAIFSGSVYLFHSNQMDRFPFKVSGGFLNREYYCAASLKPLVVGITVPFEF